MKKIILALIPLVLHGCMTMSVPVSPEATEEDRKYERVIAIPDVTKNDLYVKANAWAVKEFSSAESVIEFQDKEAGKIMGKFTYSDAYHYVTKQTISIDIQEGRARILIENPYVKLTIGIAGQPQVNSYTPLTTVDGVAKLKTVWIEMADSLEKALKSNDNW
jgi:hypothetical protein